MLGIRNARKCQQIIENPKFIQKYNLYRTSERQDGLGVYDLSHPSEENLSFSDIPLRIIKLTRKT